MSATAPAMNVPAPSANPGAPAQATGKPPGPPPGPPFGPRLALGLLGILLAAMVSGLNNRVVGLALTDIQGAMHLTHDSASWLNALYAAGELAAMPFSCWFAITFSLRRFHLTVLLGLVFVGALLPFIARPEWLYAFRLIQGVFAGALIPLLMMSALRFLPPPIRLHGLALYALTATFSPNVALWLTHFLLNETGDWRWVFWQVVPLGLVAAALVYVGIPKMPLALPRLKQGNWLGMALGVPGLILLGTALGEGTRLDWLNSPVICALLIGGSGLTVLFLVTEWFHGTPFMRLQLLERRNLGLGFSVFFLMLIAMTTAVGFPAMIMERLHQFKVEQVYALGAIVGLPQLVLGSLVSILLYQKWVDARKLFALGLALMATACWLTTDIDATWKPEQFVLIQCIHALGQPLAVVSLLFLGTSSVAPMEGPFVAGIINTLRALGTMLGTCLLGQFVYDNSRQNVVYLADQAFGSANKVVTPSIDLLSQLAPHALALSAADVFRFFTLIFIALIPVVLCLKFIPAPHVPKPSETQAKHS